MIIWFTLLLLAQNLTWYEQYEEGERQYRQGQYEACISSMNEAIALRPETKKNAFIRAVQKIDYNPYYYRALSHFRMGNLDRAIEDARTAFEGEVVASSPGLQVDLIPIFQEYSARIGTYLAEIQSERALRSARQSILDLIRRGEYAQARDQLAQIPANQEDQFSDIGNMLDLLLRFSRRLETTEEKTLTEIERLLGEGQPDMARAYFSAIREIMAPEAATILQKRIDDALAVQRIRDQAEQTETQPAPPTRSQQALMEELESLKALQQERTSLQARLNRMQGENERLFQELNEKLSEQPEQPKAPAVVLSLEREGAGSMLISASAVIPAGFKSMILQIDGREISVEPYVTLREEESQLSLVLPHEDVGYGSHAVTVEVTDLLDRTAGASKTINMPIPLFARRWVHVAVSFVFALSGLVWLGFSIRRRRRARLQHFNPYIAGGPVINRSMFFGRDNLLQRIEGLVHRNCLMIYGERRIGKTSLLYQLKARLMRSDSPEYRFFPAFIDLQGIHEQDLFRHIMDDLVTAYPEWKGYLHTDSSEYTSRRFSRDMKTVIAELKRHNRRHPVVVLLMDEVDVINEFSEKTNQRLRSIFMKDFADHLSCVMAGIHLKKEWESSGSPWYNFFEEIPMTPFDLKAARALIQKPVEGIFRFKREALDLIVNESGCHPYLIQKICVSLINSKLKQNRYTITRNDVLLTINQMTEETKMIRGEAP